MNRLIGAALLLSSSLVGIGCKGTPPADLYDPYVDLGIELTGNTEGGLIDDQGSAFVSDINSQYEITNLELITGAAIGEAGSIIPGPTDVLVIEFVSKGEFSLTSLDERNIKLMLEIGHDATDRSVLNGYLAGKGSGIAAIARNLPSDSFVNGKVWFILRDKSFAVGQLNVNFNGHRISGNFRVLVRAR